MARRRARAAACMMLLRGRSGTRLTWATAASWSVRAASKVVPRCAMNMNMHLNTNGYKMASRRNDQPDNSSTRASYKPTTASTITSIISQFLQQLGILPQAILDLLILSTLIPHFLSSYFAMFRGKSFDTSKDIPDLSGKVILVTGGM